MCAMDAPSIDTVVLQTRHKRVTVPPANAKRGGLGDAFAPISVAYRQRRGGLWGRRNDLDDRYLERLIAADPRRILPIRPIDDGRRSVAGDSDVSANRTAPTHPVRTAHRQEWATAISRLPPAACFCAPHSLAPDRRRCGQRQNRSIAGARSRGRKPTRAASSRNSR